MIGVSPTYLSKVERDEFPPPAEDKVNAIALVLERNKYDLLQLAGRIPSELIAVIRENQQSFMTLLPAAPNQDLRSNLIAAGLRSQRPEPPENGRAGERFDPARQQFESSARPLAEQLVSAEDADRILQKLWNVAHPHRGLGPKRAALKSKLKPIKLLTDIKKANDHTTSAINALAELHETLSKLDSLENRDALSDVIGAAIENLEKTIRPILNRREKQLSDQAPPKERTSESHDPGASYIARAAWSAIIHEIPDAKIGSKSQLAPAGRLVQATLHASGVRLSDSRIRDLLS